MQNLKLITHNSKLKRIFIVAFALLLVLSNVFNFLPNKDIVHAETMEELMRRTKELSDELEAIKRQKAEVESKIKQEEATQKNLSSSISYISYQIQKTELTIQEKQGQIEKNEADIQVLGAEIVTKEGQIKNLEDSISYLEEVIQTRNKENYMNSKVSWLETILSAKSLSGAVKEWEYFSAIRKHDDELLGNLETNKTNLSTEKEDLSNQKAEVEKLKAEIEFEKGELEEAKDDLAWQQKQKEQMLADSNARENEQRNHYDNLDAEYQKKMDELNAVQTRLAQATVSGTNVKQGWTIGFQGATGYVVTWKSGVGWTEGDGVCEGYHVHFSVWEKNPSTGSWYAVDPAKYILTGKIRRPFNDGEYTISQYYGATYNGLYKSGFHYGIDYVGTKGCGAAVYAAGDGVIQYGYDYYHAGTNDSKGAYYAWIYHGEIDGVEVKTGYWHLKYP